MSTQTSQPPPTTPPPAQPQAGQQLATSTPTPLSPQQAYKNPMLHTAALVCTPVAFLGLLLPPRRIDFRAVVLGSTGIWGVSQLKYDYTGKSMLHDWWLGKGGASAAAAGPSTGGLTSDLPSERAAEVSRLIKEEKARRERAREMLASGMSEQDVRRVQELERRRQAAGVEQPQSQQSQQHQSSQQENGEKGTLEAIWMGDADKDWREKRAKREQEALSEGGEGIWGLITEQISDVFSRGERKAQEEKLKKGEGDEKKSS